LRINKINTPTRARVCVVTY